MRKDVEPGDGEYRRRQSRALFALAAAELLSMSLWLSASAVVPELQREWSMSAGTAAWMTMSVQFGFVAGSVISAVFTLSDIWSPRRLFAASALAGATFTASIPLFSQGPQSAIPLRFLTGLTLAGVYPPGMKIMAGWFRDRRGYAIGVMVGALTVGTALPHLLRAGGGIGDWRKVLYGAAFLSLIGAWIVLQWLEDGPYQAPRAPFDPSAIGRILTDRGTMLANLGYFGHMWELYAMWTWIPVFLTRSFAMDSTPWSTPRLAGLCTFATIAVGGLGAWWAGWAADRYGRTRITSLCLIVSGSCCLVAGPLFGGSAPFLIVFCLIWGLAIVADSAQFSTSVTELAEQQYVGTALTLQTAVGFLLTTVSIRLVPVWEQSWGWSYAFAPLVLGPLVGTVAMAVLGVLPESRKLAGGRG